MDDARSAEAEAAQLARDAEHRLQEAALRDAQHAQVPPSLRPLSARPGVRPLSSLLSWQPFDRPLDETRNQLTAGSATTNL